MRVALYGRVSTSRQDLDGQLEDLRRFATARGWAIAQEYGDVISGATVKRPGLAALLRDAHQRCFDVVVVARLDRLVRSLVHLVQVIDELLVRGIEVVSATEPHMDSTTPAGRRGPARRDGVGAGQRRRALSRTRVRPGRARDRMRRSLRGSPRRARERGASLRGDGAARRRGPRAARRLPQALPGLGAHGHGAGGRARDADAAADDE